MKVSLNWIKKYIDLPKDLTSKQIAYDLTLRTVEVESVENTAEKYNNIVVGKILEVKPHPNADKLRVCMVDIGEKEPKQIVCGGSNLYEGEFVVVSKPGALVVWHGEGEPVEIKETKMRGESSFGMICGAEEVYLDSFFPPQDEHEIVDLKGINCYPGQNISELICMDDTVIEIDNKSLTNRPDLWGHYGIARELSAIYNVPLKELSTTKVEEGLKEYKVEIKEPEKCRRYVAIEIDNVEPKESPMWMKSALINAGMRPINLIVDITNYVMLAVGQPLHAFDKTHVAGEKIIVRNAKKDEELLLLDNNTISLTEDDLVIADEKDALALAGIRGGKKDSILEDTKGILLEIANFTAKTIRKTGKRFDEKTDASIRYEKNIDTERVGQGMSLALDLFKEFFPESKVVAYKDEYPIKTEREHIQLPQEFLDIRLGKVLDEETVTTILTSLGYDVEYKNNIYNVVAPVWRSTGDVSLKDDVLGDIARILSYDSFEAKPLTIKVEKPVIQNNILLERRIKEYLAYRCGLNEVFTYPWIDEKYIKAARIATDNLVALATPPSPEQQYLRGSLVPGMLEAVNKNLRYYDSFRIFEMAQCFEQGKYYPSSEDECLPVHKKLVTGCIVGKNAKEIFYEAKGIVESLSGYCHTENIELVQGEKPSWADVNAHLDITSNGNVIGHLGLVSLATMTDAKIKHTNVAMFEINVDEITPKTSRTNKYNALPQLPLVEKDLAVLVNDEVTWKEISDLIKNKVKEHEFKEEYRGSQIPEGKKSIMFRVKMSNDESTMTTEEINTVINSILKTLNKKLGAELREE